MRRTSSLFGSIAVASLSCCLWSCGAPSEEAGDDGELIDTTQQAVLGDAVPGLTAEEAEGFAAGLEEFQSQETTEDGVGPIFNENSCVNCHDAGAVGGGSPDLETRFGRVSRSRRDRREAFDPLVNLGGSLKQDKTIGLVSDACNFALEVVPPEANVTALRRTQPLFGLGLVDVLQESTLLDIANRQPRSVRGRTNRVFNIAAGTETVGKFGWKAQVPSLFQFSGDAYLNEMGITSPDFPNEHCPNDVDECALVQACDPVPGVDDDGEDVDLFFAFMRFLGAPPRGAVGDRERRGERVFDDIGCASCHTATLRTPNDSSLPAAVRNVTFHPYSDFLLHDMGSLGDGIGAMGRAELREMRTQPLWGLRFVTTFLHDGRATTVKDAIRAHSGRGASARDAFGRLRSRSQDELLAFLNSL